MAGHSLYLIPFQDKVLIYRPLRRILFLGNRALADRAQLYCESQDRSVLADEPDVLYYFDSIGFTAAALLMSNRCNLRCIYCYANGGETNNLDLDPETAKRAVDTVCENAQKLNEEYFSVVF